jgi:ribosome-binding ATPase
VDAVIHVIRCFDDENIVHVAGGVDPEFDKEVIDTELQLKDLESIDKKIARLEKIAKSGDARARKDLEVLQTFKSELEAGKNARAVPIDKEEFEAVRDLHLLTIKPVLYVANVDEKSLSTGNKYVDQLREKVKDEHADVIILCAAIESQIAELDDAEEKSMFLAEYGLDESGLNKLISGAYKLLDLITYFTAGVQEVRAWTIKKGWKAPQAAGVIHTDFERGFIKAEVIKLSDYEMYKSEAGCRENGKISIEGKEYIVQDGDIMHFRFNV